MLVRSCIVFMGLINVMHMSPALAMEDLSKSILVNYQEAILDAYDDAVKQFNNDKRQPLIFYITKNNNSYSWLSLVNLAIDKNQLRSRDLVWIIDEHVYACNLNKEKSANLFKSAIIDQINNTKRSAYIVDLLTSLSVEKKTGWLLQYYPNETYNILVEIIEKGYTNMDYIKVFKQIIELIPADMLNHYLSVKRTENGIDKSI